MSYDLLTINDKNILDVKPEALTIKPISDLWKADKSNDKKQALKQLAFIYWMYNWNSIYFKGYPDEQERFNAVIVEVFNDISWKPDIMVSEASKVYQKLQEEAYPALSHLKAARKTLDGLKQFLNEVDPNERTNAGGLVLKPAEIYTAIGKMGDALIAVEKMEEKVKSQIQLEESKLRGGGKAGAFEDDDKLDYL